MDNLPFLSLLILTPALGAILLACLDKRYVREIRQGALLVSVVTLLLALGALMGFMDADDPAAMQLTEKANWIPALNITYHLGVDGISILLILLTAGLMPIIQLSTWSAVTDRVKEFQISLLLLQSGMMGAFVALDLILFYLFWEAMLIPMYLIVGVWGGERRIYAAVKFFIYTMVGSLMMFLAILYLGHHCGTFNFIEITDSFRGGNTLSSEAQCWLFAGFALSFAVKVPLFPFHTWLPDAHVEAPTAGSVVLAGVLLKMGTYGFIRFMAPMFPEGVEAFSPAICWLSVIGIIFGACMAFVQPDIKKLIAYSSVSHMGFVTLGLFVWTKEATAGALLQMVNHGLSTSMLFLLVGIIYERRHTREISNYGGLAQSVPVFCTFFIIATLSSIGLPGLNGFVGEFLVLFGTFSSDLPHIADAPSWLPKLWGTLAATGVVLGAAYMLQLVKQFMFGPLVHEENRTISDLNAREWIYLVPLVVMMVWIGLYPKPFLNLIEPSIKQLLALQM